MTSRNPADSSAPVCQELPIQKWTVWYYENVDDKSWKENLKAIATSTTLQDILRLKRPSEISQGCDFSVFKEGIEPTWENPININGGRWVITLDSKFLTNYVDRVWMDVCACLVEGPLANNDEVCGTTLKRRDGKDRITIWLKDSSNKKAVLEIGEEIRKIPQGIFTEKFRIVFVVHKAESFPIKPKFFLQ